LDPLQDIPSTPERDRMAERDRDRIEHLNMTATDDRRSRSRAYAAPQGAPVPQSVFIRAEGVPVPQSVFTQAEVDYVSSSTGWNVPQATASFMREQFIQARSSGPMVSQTVADDLFGSSPPRENTPNIPIQNVPNLPMHQVYPQNVPQPEPEPYFNPWIQRWEYPGARNMPNPMPPPQHVPYQHAHQNTAYQQPQTATGSVPMHAPMPPQHVPHQNAFQHSAYYQPQPQMGSASNAVPNISAQHQTLHPVQSNPALNNVHHGQIAHREREAAHRQSLCGQEYILRCHDDREIGKWAVPDELARQKENASRRILLLPDRPPPDLHQHAAHQHVLNQQRMAELAPHVISRLASVPQDFLPLPGQGTECNAALHEKRRKKEKRHAATEAQKLQNHNQIMAHWTVQHAQEETRLRQIREEKECQEKERNAQRMENDMRRDQARKQEMRRAQLDSHTQDLLEEYQRKQMERGAQQVENEMRIEQARKLEQLQNTRAQHLFDVMRLEQLDKNAHKLQRDMRREQMNRDAQRMQEDLRREQVDRDAQRMQEDLRREQVDRDAQRLQDQIRTEHIREQEELHQRLSQLDAQCIENEYRQRGAGASVTAGFTGSKRATSRGRGTAQRGGRYREG
jgi:hypothetical protein